MSAVTAMAMASPRSADIGPEAGSDLEYQVNVPFWTAIRGGVMKLNIARRDVCGNCHGNGFTEIGRHRPGGGQRSGVPGQRAVLDGDPWRRNETKHRPPRCLR